MKESYGPWKVVGSQACTGSNGSPVYNCVHLNGQHKKLLLGELLWFDLLKRKVKSKSCSIGRVYQPECDE